MVRDVEELKPQLEALLLLDAKTLAHRSVDIKVRGPQRGIRTRVAKCARCARNERTGVQPVLGTEVSYVRVSRHYIRTIQVDTAQRIVNARENGEPRATVNRKNRRKLPAAKQPVSPPICQARRFDNKR